MPFKHNPVHKKRCDCCGFCSLSSLGWTGGEEDLCWGNSYPRKMVEPLSLEVSRTQLDKAMAAFVGKSPLRSRRMGWSSVCVSAGVMFLIHCFLAHQYFMT